MSLRSSLQRRFLKLRSTVRWSSSHLFGQVGGESCWLTPPGCSVQHWTTACLRGNRLTGSLGISYCLLVLSERLHLSTAAETCSEYILECFHVLVSAGMTIKLIWLIHPLFHSSLHLTGSSKYIHFLYFSSNFPSMSPPSIFLSPYLFASLFFSSSCEDPFSFACAVGISSNRLSDCNSVT